MDRSESFSRTVLSALGWATATRFAAQIMNWAMTFVVVRLISPEEYGLMAITMAVAGFLQSLSYAGFSDAIVQRSRLSDEELRDVFGLIVVINLAFLLVICAASYPLAGFYGEPRLAALLQAAALMFPIITVLAIPRAKLEKALALKQISRVEVAGNLLSGAGTVVLAWAGAGVWSLLIGMLLNAALRALGYELLAPSLTLPRFRFARHGQVIRFGGLRSAENVLWYLYTNVDVFLIGKMLGQHSLGIYSIALYVARLPLDKLAPVIKPVAFPAFSAIQDDAYQAVRYLCKANEILALIGFPVFFGISATAPELVDLLLGPSWRTAAEPLRLLALAMSLRLIGLVIPSFLQGMGNARASLANTVFATFLFSAAFVIGCNWGVVGVCVAWLVATPIHFLNLVRRVNEVADVSLEVLLEPLLRPLAGSAIMYALVTATRALLPEQFPLSATLAVLVCTGVLCYGVFVLIFCRPLLAGMFALAGSQMGFGRSD